MKKYLICVLISFAISLPLIAGSKPKEEKMSVEWERITESTYRLKIHGGWLVRTKTFSGSIRAASQYAVDIKFIEDEYHNWVIGEEKEPLEFMPMRTLQDER